MPGLQYLYCIRPTTKFHILAVQLAFHWYVLCANDFILCMKAALLFFLLFRVPTRSNYIPWN